MRYHFYTVVGLCSLLAASAAFGQFEGPAADDAARTEQLVTDLYRAKLARDAAHHATLVKEALTAAPDDRRVNALAGRVRVEGKWLHYGDHQKSAVADERLVA